jgi:hypothetical protein
LHKDLAELVEGSTKAIRLTFEAKGDGHKEGDYMIEDRSNICVSCGASKNLTMHHVGKKLVDK